MLLRQYVQEALAAKASGGSTKLYDQCVPPAAAGHRSAHRLSAVAAAAHRHTPTSPSHTHRLVSEMKRLKSVLRPLPGTTAPADAAAAEQLVALLRGLGACVSLLQERRHELLLKELLDTPLWHAPQVGAGRALLTAGGHSPAASAAAPLLLTRSLPPWMQALRLALLDWMTHAVVANGALVQTCLQTLVYSLLPPPGPPLPDPNPGEAWQASEAQALIQDEVLAAAEKVRCNACPLALAGSRAV